MNRLTLENSIERALDFLQQRQLPSGEFPCYLTRLQGEPVRILDVTPFATCVVTTSLAFYDSPVIKDMTSSVCDLLRSQMEPFGVWRYWPPPNPQSSYIRPDVDDTAMVSALLRHNGVSIPSNRNLILANRNQAGLFYTWIVPRPVLRLSLGYWWVALQRLRKPFAVDRPWQSEAQPDDIDGIVNSNVLSYLGEGHYAEAVCKYLIDVFDQHREESCDRWYQNRFVFYYSVARNYREGFSAFSAVREEMIERIISGTAGDGSIGSGAMDTAHAVCALLNLDSDAPQIRPAIDYLIREQGDQGEWPYYHYYFSGHKRLIGWGSEELTTAFCIQALSRYATRVNLNA